MNKPRRIGILGGTFDPIHRGHTDLGAAADGALELSRVFVIPANVPPHRPHTAASMFHRFAMVSMAVAGRPTWRASDLELRSQPPSYTATTLKCFHERGYAPAELFFVIGADAFADVTNWKDYPRVLDGAHFAVVSRPGCSIQEMPHRLPMLASRMTSHPFGPLSQLDASIILIDAPTADISSSAIRDRLAAGDSITGMVHPSVQQHIEQHGLYSSSSAAADIHRTSQAGRLHGQD